MQAVTFFVINPTFHWKFFKNKNDLKRHSSWVKFLKFKYIFSKGGVDLTITLDTLNAYFKIAS